MMDCSDARTYFPWLTLSPVGELAGELEAAQQHLEQCPDCRSAVRRDAAGDRELSLQMSAVSLPDGLSARLQQRIAAQQALQSTVRPSKTGRRVGLWAAAAAALILAVIGPWLVQTFSPATIAMADVLSLIQQNPDFVSWPVAVRQDLPLPADWPEGSQLTTQAYRWNPEASVPVYAAGFEFRPPRGAEPVSGTLWRVKADQIRDAGELPSLESAAVEYLPNYGRLIWREDAVIYIVTLEGRALEQLLKKLLNSRSWA